MEEYKSPEVTFRYWMPEHSSDVYLHVNASRMYSILHDIDQRCRSVIKYEDHPSEDRIRLAEDIRNMISQIDMDM